MTRGPDVCFFPGVASLVHREMAGTKENWFAPLAPCLVRPWGHAQPSALSSPHPDSVLSCL